MLKNEEKFSGKAEIYKKFRPSYSQELIDYLCSELGFCSKSAVADIGSGTGIFSRLLLELGSTVYGVEPNEDMRAIAEKDFCSSNNFNFISINATAENTGLKEKSIDFVTTAQAFHWFDIPQFKKECKRILKNNAKVALILNTRDNTSEIMQLDYTARKKYAVDLMRLDAKYISDNLGNFFLDGKYEELTFKNDLFLDRDSYIGMTLSRSYSPRESLNPNLYYGLIKELNRIFDEFNINGKICFPQFTKAYIGQV